MNLIENAIKYVSPGGRIDVSVAAEPDAIVLQVADNGPGIPAADRQRILQPFVRLERDREQVGSGLGLSLVAAVVRLHRGSIELLDNDPGLIVRCQVAERVGLKPDLPGLDLHPDLALVALRRILAAENAALLRRRGFARRRRAESIRRADRSPAS